MTKEDNKNLPLGHHFQISVFKGVETCAHCSQPSAAHESPPTPVPAWLGHEFMRHKGETRCLDLGTCHFGVGGECMERESAHGPESAAPLPQPVKVSYPSSRNETAVYMEPAPLLQNPILIESVETTFNNLTFKETEQELGNLLAIIHRDGGHHTQRVGFRQSVRDAHEVWAKLQEEIEDLKSSRYDGID